MMNNTITQHNNTSSGSVPNSAVSNSGNNGSISIGISAAAVVSNNVSCNSQEQQDLSQWLSITEETLFLHDGLLRLSDIVELPQDVNNVIDSGEHEVVTLDTKTPAELSEHIMSVCGTQNNAYSRLLEYRLNALCGFWNAQHQVAASIYEQQHQQPERENPEDLNNIIWKKQGNGSGLKDVEQQQQQPASFSTRISLLLVLPLLESMSRNDPELCSVSASVLLECLKECTPFSLSKEPADCMKGLEQLLCNWLKEKCSPNQPQKSSSSSPKQERSSLPEDKSQQQRTETPGSLPMDSCGSTIQQPSPSLPSSSSTSSSKHKQQYERVNAASALVALACARGHLELFIHTVHLLQMLKDIEQLPLADTLSHLLDTEGGPGQTISVLGNKHVICWGFEDLLNSSEKDSVEKEKDKDEDYGRSIACDSIYLYVTNASGKGLAKLGTGLHGSLRGYVYCRNLECGPGKIAFANGILLYRPHLFDNDSETTAFALQIDPHTLQPLKCVFQPEDYSVAGNKTTIAFCSDGIYFYWIWCQANLNEKVFKGQMVFLEVFNYDIECNVMVSVRERVLLQKKEETNSKSLNDTLLSKLRPYRPSGSTAALVAISGVDTVSARKDDANFQGNTSCGVTLKNLIKTPIFSDGTSVVLLSPIPGGTNTGPARNLFGGSLAAIRSLATNMCFNVFDGLFNSRVDLVDAPACSLARGASVLGLGVCFDSKNNLIWSCGNDLVDQFHNPAHKSPHIISQQLGFPFTRSVQLPSGNNLPVSQVVNQLLQHVCSMCIHQINSSQCTLSPLTSPTSIIHLPIETNKPLDLIHLQRICDILQRAITNQSDHIIICCLVVLQQIFKITDIKMEEESEIKIVKEICYSIWKLLSSYVNEMAAHNLMKKAIENEACLVISTGWTKMYPTLNDRNTLLINLLTEGESSGVNQLRNLILVDLAERIKSEVMSKDNTSDLRLSDDLVQLILKITVKESCILLRKAKDANKEDFEKLLSSIPLASPSTRYLMALQSNLLRKAVFHSQNSGTKKTEESEDDLQKLQYNILTLSSKIFNGTYEVLEVLIETCTFLISKHPNNLEFWLQGVERIAKATGIGHLLPVLITAMTHNNLQHLRIADALMPQLVQLVVLTSQATLLMKSQVESIQEDDIDFGTDDDFIDLIGEAVNLEQVEIEDDEERGFLAGLKIPAPWASGKTVETIHPVRDNYKFKETVHIPGARCLYLRFDPRCSSQYDYDKLTVYSGPNTNSKKVAEYGGNTLGFGSRSVLGSGWPKDLIRVEGDTVTFSFEMRSGREHNTPNKAMWGFAVTVRAQNHFTESAEEVSCGLPFLADLALGLSVLACTMLQLLYQGPEKTPQEFICDHLLKSKLLQRCVWQSRCGDKMIPVKEISWSNQEDENEKTKTSKLPRIKLPMEIMRKLRQLSMRPRPQLRPSIRDVINPDFLEERVISAALKHSSLTESLHCLSQNQQQTEEFLLLSSVTEEVFKRTDALVRQLQSLAELEQRWHNEVNDLKQEASQFPPFFDDYHLQETKLKELTMLCFLKDVELDLSDPEESIKFLREKFQDDIKSGEILEPMRKTKKLVQALINRLDLLLHVNIAPADGEGSLVRSISSYTSEQQSFMSCAMTRSDTNMLETGKISSKSCPSNLESSQDDSIIEIMKLQRRRQARKKAVVSILQDLVEDDQVDKPPHIVLIDQLFNFIGSNPEKAISCEDFLSAAQIRYKRGITRKQALVHMKALLTAAAKVGGSTHLVAAVTSVLQRGPRVHELTCGGLVAEVQDAFGETMTSVVQLAAHFPIACSNSIGLLCIIPYTRCEEKCLVRSGLVHLLDKLCSLGTHRSDGVSSECQNTRQKVAALAWAGFQVLANRCVTWETEDVTLAEEVEHSGLACQVSLLLTNYLTRATECSGNEAAGTEALQEVLSLLNTLSRSRMGKDILSQPACVSKLLSLLLDQRPSPKLVLIILQLCRVALPLMSTTDCEKVTLPSWGQHLYLEDSQNAQPARIVSLLLAKLGDFLVPGEQMTLSSQRSSCESLSTSSSPVNSADKDKTENSDIQDGRLSVFIHKREDQSSHEVIQPLLSSDSRPFRIGVGTSMEKVVRMDREMTKHCRAEIITEDAVNALKKAAKWAQMGIIVSTGPPIDIICDSTVPGDKKKTAAEFVCKEKNAELARMDPVRPFISGHVANSMAAEVIDLLHSLLTAPESNTAQTWAEAVQRVLTNALTCLSTLLGSVDSLGSPQSHPYKLMSMAKQANAALCALGGFKESIKPGCNVKVIGSKVHNTMGTVISVSEPTGIATIQLEPDPINFYAPRFSDIIHVPLARLVPPRNQFRHLHHLPTTEAVIMAVRSILMPQDSYPSFLQQNLPVNGDGNTLANQICRVVAEIKTRACMVLAIHLHELSFAQEFIRHCDSAIETLKSVAKECGTGERQPVIELHCEHLRMLYRDCAKPPPPPSKISNKVNKEIVWDASRSFPPVRSCLFSHGMTGITFLGDPSVGTGFPRGTMVYAAQPIPSQAPSFYWELEIHSFGDCQEESGATVSFGFAPPAEKKDGAWTNPVGTCLFLNNGKAVHYNGASLLQWRSVRLDVSLNTGDIAGVGWECTEESGGQGQTPKGQVYFTFNGRRLGVTLDDVAGAMYPVVHIQKKNTRVKANFGARPFAYAEGWHHREAADACNDLTREIRESFIALPFHSGSDSDSEGPTTTSTSSSVVETRDYVKSYPGPPCKIATIPKPAKDYDVEMCLQYKLIESYDNFVCTGSDPHTQANSQEDESDEEAGEDDQCSEDYYALLVKAWEQKVFPVIRRRFRNEAERKDGLEQIRGALQLGMTDIARQTVEFLYEENGGIPRDLHLPTIDDIKEDLAKFTIERVKKGITVVICTPSGIGTSGTAVLPKYAVRSMLRTFGLTGNVLDIDPQNELVQVETYLRTEGVLVRFWYPIDMLERPPQGLRKSSITGGQTLDTSNVLIHRELLKYEMSLSRIFCRSALLELIDHCNSLAMNNMSCLNISPSMAASAALLQELDIENLQLRSNELLTPPQPHGCITTCSLSTCITPNLCLKSNTCSLTEIMYTNPDKLKRELAIAIARAAKQGEDYLIELTNQLCLCLQTAPEMFPCEDFPITEVKINTDVHFPSAACLVVSCRSDPKTTKKDSSPYKAPWARVYSYTGHKVKKSGQAMKQEVVCYPRDTTSSSNQNDQYIPVLVPCDKIHLRAGVCPPPGIILNIYALPPQFLLAIAYIETLVTEKYGCGKNACSQRDEFSFVQAPVSKENLFSLWSTENIIITPPVFSHIIELLCGYMWRSEVPSFIKEYIFHLLSQALRILHFSEGGVFSGLPTLNPQFSPTRAIMKSFQIELQKLYEEETKEWTSTVTASGTGIGIGTSDHGRFSTYFQALLELMLAVSEVTQIHQTSNNYLSSSASCNIEQSTSSMQMPTSPSVINKKKKVKVKRDKTVSVRRSSSVKTSDGESSAGSPVPSTSQLGTQLSSTSLGSDHSSTSTTSDSSNVKSQPAPSIKPEDMLWFHRVLTVSGILRCMVFKEKRGEEALKDAISDAAQVLISSTAHSRLLVISNIPSHISKPVLKKAISKACCSNGGIDREELYIPTIIEKKQASATQDSQNGASASSLQISIENKATEPSITTSLLSATDSYSENIRGYAVVALTSRTKIDNVRSALFKSRHLIDPEGIGDVPEEILSIHTVSQLVSTEPQATYALEDYLIHKLFLGNQFTLCDGAVMALTDIFHCCFISEQRHGENEYRQDSGYICLSKEQILQNLPENLLCTFLNKIRPPKKSLLEQVGTLLRHYGILKSPDKDLSPGAEKNGKPKLIKKSPKSLKEKYVMGPQEKVNSKDRKSKGKETAEKTIRESCTAESTAKLLKALPKEEEKFLTLEGFIQFVVDTAKQDVNAVWRALFACGFDLHFERCSCIDVSQAQQMSKQWTLEMDNVLVNYIDSFCRKLAISPSRLHPHEIYITENQLANEKYMLLQGMSIESIRLRFALLQFLNNTLETFFIPLIDLQPIETFSCSTASLMAHARGLMFYDSKVNLMNRVLNATAKRKPDQAAPEITLDPLEIVGAERKESMKTTYCQAFCQLSNIPSSQLCVRLASGGDPTFSFNVRLIGEEVHGTSGSFRHFLSQIAKELSSPLLNLLIPCASSSGSRNKGKCILKPGPMTYSEEKLLEFFGQLLGVTIRADIPIGLDLLGSFWKCLVKTNLDQVMDLQEADILTYNYIKKIEMVETESELQALCADVYSQFTYSSLTGQEVELITQGKSTLVTWENRHTYVEKIRQLRIEELTCLERMEALKAGFASVIPIQLLTLMTPANMELRVCGLPYIDLDFLKAHTMYQVGLTETDQHIEFFWTALESFGQDDLGRFIKFACNQERIPQTCPCRDGSSDTAHVPPYPMKIAPPDGPGSPDNRYIRVETCMFMIKLPQYSTQEIMTQRILYAINCREDPLSG